MLNESYTWRDSLTWSLFRRVLLALLALVAFAVIGGFIQTKIQHRAWDDVTGGSGQDMYNIRYSPDFSLIATDTLGDGVYLWNARNKTLLNKLGPSGLATQLEFSPEHPEFAWSYTSYAFFYTKSDGRMDKAPVEAKSWIYSLALAPSEFAVVATGSSAVELWNAVIPDATYHLVADYSTETSVYALDFSDDSELLAAGLGDGRVIAWRVDNSEPAEEFKTDQVLTSKIYADTVQQVTFSPDNQVIAASDGNTVTFLRVSDGKALRKLEVPGFTYRFAFSPDSSLLVVPHTEENMSSFDRRDPGVISVWRVDTGEKVWRSEQLHSPIANLQVAPDNKTISAGHFDGEVRTYKMP